MEVRGWRLDATLASWGGFALVQCDVFGEGLEAHAVGLDDGNGDVTRLAGFDVSHYAGFAGVRSGDDLAFGAIGEFFVRGRFHWGECTPGPACAKALAGRLNMARRKATTDRSAAVAASTMTD